MTGDSKRELLLAVRPRYLHTGKAEKGRILDEFVAATGYHRKYAIDLLQHGSRRQSGPHRTGRTPYGPAVVCVLTDLWEQSGHLCGKRLWAFLPIWIEALERQPPSPLEPKVKPLVLSMSPATIDRKLRPARRRQARRGLRTTRAGRLLKQQVPIRTFADWDDAPPASPRSTWWPTAATRRAGNTCRP